MPGEAFIARKVWKQFRATIALSDVSVAYGKGLNVIMGPNGSGKSTLLRLFLGLLKPSKGVVESLGLTPWKATDKLLKNIGACLEGTSLPWWLSGIDVIRMFASRRGLEWARIKEIAEELGVTAYWHRPIIGYSMGMRKKLLLLMAFSGVNEALVLDEPYTLLDSKTIELVDKYIALFSKEVPVLLATHIVTEGVLNADTLTILTGGHVKAHISKEETGRAVLCKVRDFKELLNSLTQVANKVEQLSYRSNKNRIILSLVDEKFTNKLQGVETCKNILPGLIEYMEYS